MGYQVMKTKIIMYLSRNKDCQAKYGKEFDILKAEKGKARKEYKRMKNRRTLYPSRAH